MSIVLFNINSSTLFYRNNVNYISCVTHVQFEDRAKPSRIRHAILDVLQRCLLNRNVHRNLNHQLINFIQSQALAIYFEYYTLTKLMRDEFLVFRNVPFRTNIFRHPLNPFHSQTYLLNARDFFSTTSPRHLYREYTGPSSPPSIDFRIRYYITNTLYTIALVYPKTNGARIAVRCLVQLHRTRVMLNDLR